MENIVEERKILNDYSYNLLEKKLIEEDKVLILSESDAEGNTVDNLKEKKLSLSQIEKIERRKTLDKKIAKHLRYSYIFRHRAVKSVIGQFSTVISKNILVV